VWARGVINPRDSISTYLSLIESKVQEIYRANIVAKKVQDEFGTDLPPSYAIGGKGERYVLGVFFTHLWYRNDKS